MATYFVIMVERGAEKQWPEEGRPLIKHKAMDTPLFAWVRSESAEQAARTAYDTLDPQLQRRLDRTVRVMLLPDETESELVTL